MVQLTDTEFAAVARKKTPLIGPGSERRVPNGRGGTTTADMSDLDRLIIGGAVRVEFAMQTPTQLRSDIDLAIKALTEARNVLTQIDRKDRSLMVEAKDIILALSSLIGKHRKRATGNY